MIPMVKNPELLLTEEQAYVGWSLIDPGPKAWTYIHAFPSAGMALNNAMLGVDPGNHAEVVEAARNLTIDRVQEQLTMAKRAGISILTPASPYWPHKMSLIIGREAPFALYCAGDQTLLAQATLFSFLGARASTGYGEHVTMEFAAGVADSGAVVTSNGGFGIAGTALRAALASGEPAVAVAAGPVDRAYPSGNATLLGRVRDQGVVVSAAPLGTGVTRARMLRAGRVQVGLSSAALLVEAATRSNSLDTARFALDVLPGTGAVPGPITSAASTGTHALLQEGARLITTIEEAKALLV